MPFKVARPAHLIAGRACTCLGDDVANWSEMSNEEKLDYLLVTLSQIDHEVKRIEQGVFSVSTELTRRINDVLERLNKLSGDAQ
jgi:hypothetical protein